MFESKEENRSENEKSFKEELISILKESPLQPVEQFQAFPVFTERQRITSFISRYELFKKILDIQGSIIVCGVHTGFDVFSFYHLSSILEPLNYQRKIIGFDTFEGFSGVGEKDKGDGTSRHMYEGGQKADVANHLKKLIKIHNQNRALPHIEKSELIEGDFLTTCDKFLEKIRNLFAVCYT